jgi:hypothetical protein
MKDLGALILSASPQLIEGMQRRKLKLALSE